MSPGHAFRPHLPTPNPEQGLEHQWLVKIHYAREWTQHCGQLMRSMAVIPHLAGVGYWKYHNVSSWYHITTSLSSLSLFYALTSFCPLQTLQGHDACWRHARVVCCQGSATFQNVFLALLHVCEEHHGLPGKPHSQSSWGQSARTSAPYLPWQRCSHSECDSFLWAAFFSSEIAGVPTCFARLLVRFSWMMILCLGWLSFGNLAS